MKGALESNDYVIVLLYAKSLTYLRINPQWSVLFNKGLDNSCAAKGIWSHHQQLILLHRVEE